jgi:glycosyltransferase involved in cell wall biosynthesis
MIADGMILRGHHVQLCTASSIFSKLALPDPVRKWTGYIDQYLIFPALMRKRLSEYPLETLFVFADQALGPWVPLVKDRLHVIHCHDFLAQFSAENKVAENKVSYTGKKYQSYIRKGYSKGKAFISVSKKTREDLHYFLGSIPLISEVVYNGVNSQYKKEDIILSRSKLKKSTCIDIDAGYLLHVGGNQWYKNRVGVIEIYDAWRSQSVINLPLLLIGESPDKSLLQAYMRSPYKSEIHFLSNISDEYVKYAYSGARLFIFPSYAEGFGWPIAEAMACGCPVLTTNESPMTEVGGDAAYLIPRRPASSTTHWAENAARQVEEIINLTGSDLEHVINVSLSNASRFDQTTALNKIEEIYLKVIKQSKTS